MSLSKFCFLLSLLAVSRAGVVDYLTGYDDLSSKVDKVQESTQKHIDALYKRIKSLEEKMGTFGSGQCVVVN